MLAYEALAYFFVYIFCYLPGTSANLLQEDAARLQACEALGIKLGGSEQGQFSRPSFVCGLCGHLFTDLTMLEKHRCKRLSAASSRAAVYQSQTNGAVGDVLPRPVAEANAGVEMGDEVVGESGYMCGECGENFLDESSAYSHMLTKHMCTYAAQLLSFLVHGQVTIIFVVSVGLSVCLFLQFFSAVFDPISIKLGHMLYVWV